MGAKISSSCELEIDENGIPIDPADETEEVKLEEESELLGNTEIRASISTEHQPTQFEDLNFEDDRDITYGRRIARYLTEHGYSWYNPRATANDPDNNCDGPSLDDAWAYFEHITLPRKLRTSSADNANPNSFKADPGECKLPTELYPYMTTPENQLGDFGIGVGIYFLSMRIFSIICFIAGLLYIPVIHFYHSNEYSQHGVSARNSLLLRGSAICTDTMWVPCPSCGNHLNDFNATRLAEGTLQSNPNTVVYFALRNLCEGAKWEQGVNHLCVAAFMIISICVLSWLLHKGALKFDEDNLTASDYSARVLDPPEGAIDPDEWERYFNGHFGSNVVYCTVALNNEKLIEALSRRRTIIQAITHLTRAELHIHEHGKLDDQEELENFVASLVAKSPPSPLWQRYLQPFGLFQDAAMLKDKFEEVNAEIEELLKVKYKATKVFVIFEYEQEQRTVLQSLSVGKFYSFFNIAGTTAFPFRDDKVLRVEEAAEPEAIRWINGLDATLTRRVGQFLLTSISLIGLLFACGYIVKEVRDASSDGAFWSGIMISVFNSIIPMAIKTINNNLEKHDNEGDAQASLYFNITIFRWSNTALLTTFLTEFTETVKEEALIDSIIAVFIAEIFTTPLIQLLDPANQFKRHFKAPRAKNQIAMNSCFAGTFYNIAERYTNMTKIVFLCGWYAVIFPAGYFFGAAALVVQYYADKFCLLRTWHVQPPIGNEISVIGRRYFFPVILVVSSVIGSYYWAGFPFDNLCIANVTSTTATGNYNLKLLSNDAYTEYTEWTPKGEGNNSYDYKYCNQNYLSNPLDGDVLFGKLLAVRSEAYIKDDYGWMSDNQYRMTKIYGLGSVVVMAFVVFVFFRYIVVYAKSLFRGTWKDDGERDSGQRYSDQKSISCYIPLIKNQNFEYPLIACDVDEIEKSNICWADPVKPFSTYSLARDIKHIQKFAKEQGREVNESNVVLAPIKYWSPKKIKED